MSRYLNHASDKPYLLAYLPESHLINITGLIITISQHIPYKLLVIPHFTWNQPHKLENHPLS